jgi:hypothetical protein
VAHGAESPEATVQFLADNMALATHSGCRTLPAAFLIRALFDPEIGADKVPRNVDELVLNYKVSLPTVTAVKTTTRIEGTEA